MADICVTRFVIICLVSCLLPMASATSYYMISGSSSTCSSSTQTIYDNSGYIYGASTLADYTSLSTVICTKTFSVSTLDSITVTLVSTEFCPSSSGDKLEIYDGSYASGTPDLTITRFTSPGVWVRSSSSGYLTFKLHSFTKCTGNYEGFKMSYSINRTNFISDAISLSVGAIVGIVIAVLVVIALAVIGCVCCCAAAGRSGGSGGQVHTVVHQPPPPPSGYPPAGGPGYPPAGAPGYPPAGGPGYPPAGPGYPTGAQPYAGGPPTYPGVANDGYSTEQVKY